MSSLKLYFQLLVSAVLIVWGCEYLSRLAHRPELAISWIGPVMIVGGAAIGARAAYVGRKGASVLGFVLLLFAAVWAWNLHYYWDPARFSRGSGPPSSFFLAPAVLIFLGTLFVAFFRYLYPGQAISKHSVGKPSAAGEIGPIEAHLLSLKKTGAGTPWYRLFLLACSAGLALLAGHLTGIEDAEQRARVIILVLILGCVATGLISEGTLTKLIPWKKE